MGAVYGVCVVHLLAGALVLPVENAQAASEQAGGGDDDPENSAPLSLDALAQAASEQAGGGDNDHENSAPLSLDALDISELDLTPEEFQAFQRAVASGRLSHLVVPWEPWWQAHAGYLKEMKLGSQGQALVQAHGSNRSRPTPDSSLPLGPSQPLPPLSNLLKSPPSPLLRWQLVDLLYAYCYTLRLYNGDWADGVEEVAAILLSVSESLSAAGIKKETKADSAKPRSTNTGSTGLQSQSQSQSQQGQGAESVLPAVPSSVPISAADALLRCLQRACEPPAGDSFSRGLAVSVTKDVACILECGRPAVLLALSDMQQLLNAAVSVVKNVSVMQQLLKTVANVVKSVSGK
eukprot:gene24955-10613_t